MSRSTYQLTITLSVNEVNTPTERHSVTNWILKNSHLCTSYKRPTLELKKVMGWRKIFHCWGSNTHQAK